MTPEFAQSVRACYGPAATGLIATWTRTSQSLAVFDDQGRPLPPLDTADWDDLAALAQQCPPGAMTLEEAKKAGKKAGKKGVAASVAAPVTAPQTTSPQTTAPQATAQTTAPVTSAPEEADFSLWEDLIRSFEPARVAG